jgi:hypothetical protein
MLGNEIVEKTPEPEKWDQIDFGFPYVPKDPNEPTSVVLFSNPNATQAEPGSTPDDKGIVDVVPLPVYEVTMENYSERMPVGVFKMEAGLMSQAGYVYERMQKTRMTSAELDGFLLDNKKIPTLTPLEKIELYKTLNKNLETDAQYLLDLHNTLQKTHENLNSVEKMKSYTLKEPESFEDKSAKRDIEAAILEEIKWVIKEKQALKTRK